MGRSQTQGNSDVIGRMDKMTEWTTYKEEDHYPWAQGTVRQPEAAGPERLDHRQQNEGSGGLV